MVLMAPLVSVWCGMTAEVVEVVDFMLSCRVQGKFIEQSLFSHLLEHHNAQQARRFG